MEVLLSEALTQMLNEQLVRGGRSTKPWDVAAFHLRPFTGVFVVAAWLWEPFWAVFSPVH